MEFPELRRLVRAHTLIDRRRLRSLHSSIIATRQVPGELAELGMSSMMAILRPERLVHLFDLRGTLPLDSPPPC